MENQNIGMRNNFDAFKDKAERTRTTETDDNCIPGKWPFERSVLRNAIFSAEWKVKHDVIASKTLATDVTPGL